MNKEPLERRPDESEIDWLQRRLFEQPGKTLKHFHVSWGEEAHKKTPEERAATINRILDDVWNGRAEMTRHFPGDSDLKVNVREYVDSI